MKSLSWNLWGYGIGMIYGSAAVGLTSVPWWTVAGLGLVTLVISLYVKIIQVNH